MIFAVSITNAPELQPVSHEKNLQEWSSSYEQCLMIKI
jgi:hypothetical protein